MKLHNPFKVSVDTDNFPLFLCSVIGCIAIIVGVLSLLGQFMTAGQIAISLVVLAVIRTVYAMTKGK